MSVKQFIIKALCVTICLASSPLSNEDITREFIEHVLRIPNPDKVLNSALERLQRNRQQELSRHQVSSQADCEESTEILPEYTETLQTSRELKQLGALLPEYTESIQGSRELRQLGGQKHYPICHLERKIKKLNTNEYEYRPAYYEEVRCASNEDTGVSNEICSSLGFSCVQWNKTIHLTRRRYTSDCWETRTMVIPAGCECMWPVHRLGDMKLRI